MINIQEFPAPLGAELVARYSQVSPATVGHLQSDGFPHGLRPLKRPTRMAGIAVTLSLPSDDSSLMHFTVDRLAPGHALVVERVAGDHHACLGGMVGYRLMLSGAEGAVVDGPVTDIDDLERNGTPIYHRGVDRRTTGIFSPDGAVNVPVKIGARTVNPGDLIVGDSDGLLVTDAMWMADNADRLLTMQGQESIARRALDEGGSIAELSGKPAALIAKTMEVTTA